jgi:DNA-binding MarR family transcriptional regulator
MPISHNQPPDDLDVLRAAIVDLVRRDTRDLTMRQLGVFLICYFDDEGQTASKLAAQLGVYKPAMTRALDRLSEENLLTRVPHENDGRSALVGMTSAGVRLLHDLRSIMQKTAASSTSD